MYLILLIRFSMSIACFRLLLSTAYAVVHIFKLYLKHMYSCLNPFVSTSAFGFLCPTARAGSALVGSSGLEPPTSRLSGARSNLLSYEPIWIEVTPAPRRRGGDDGIRTHDPLLAGQVLSQLSYTPSVSSPLSLPF